MPVSADMIAKGDTVMDEGRAWEVVGIETIGDHTIVLSLRNAAGCAADWRLGVADLVTRAS